MQGYSSDEAESRTLRVLLASLMDLNTATVRRSANEATRAEWNAAMDTALNAARAMLDAAGIDPGDEKALDRWLDHPTAHRNGSTT